MTSFNSIFFSLFQTVSDRIMLFLTIEINRVRRCRYEEDGDSRTLEDYLMYVVKIGQLGITRTDFTTKKSILEF